MTSPPDHYLKRELDARLRDDPAIFAFIESASLDGLWYWDLERPEEEWMSQKFWRTLGYDPAEMPHKASAWMDLIHPDDLALARENVARHLADPSVPYDQLVRYRHADGHEVTVRCRGIALRDADGTPTRLLGAHNDVTAMRRVERLLSETNHAARVGSWEYVVDAGEVYWSDVTKEIHEVGPAFVPTLDTGIAYYREGHSRERITEVLARATATGEGWDEELELVTERGNVRWVRAVGRVEMRDGRAVRLYGSFQDIHEQKLRDLRLAERERLLTIMGEAARVGGWEIDLRTGVVTYTDVTNEIHGLPSPQAWTSERALSYYVDGPEKDHLLALFARCCERGEGYQADFRIRTEQGEERWVRAYGRAGRDEAGRIVRAYGSFQDIHEQKLRDLRLAERETILRQNFDHAPNGMVIAAPDGTFRRVSRSFAEMLGYASGEEMVGMSFRDVTHPDDLAHDAEMMREFHSGVTDFRRMRKRYRRRDGAEMWGDVSISAVRGPDGRPKTFHAEVVDLTAERIAEERRRRVALLEDKAREMERFAYVASHDLRQPILTIQGYVEALAEDYADELADGEAEEYLRVIRGSLARMDAMIKGLLDYSRLSQAKQLQGVALGTLVAEVLDDLRGLIEESGATVDVADLATVSGYPLELRQVFQNLIANALTYRRAGVTPHVRIACACSADGVVQISVADNGRGIDPGDHERIFRLFQRAGQIPGAGHVDDGGTGIGLSTCRSIVERHGGRIWLESTLGEGSTFSFTLDAGALAEVP